jgi:hypothetical protein
MITTINSSSVNRDRLVVDSFMTLNEGRSAAGRPRLAFVSGRSAAVSGRRQGARREAALV